MERFDHCEIVTPVHRSMFMQGRSGKGGYCVDDCLGRFNRPTIVTDSTPMLFPPGPGIIRRAGNLGPFCWTSLFDARFLNWCVLSGVAGSVMTCRSWVGRSLDAWGILGKYDF